MGFWLSRYHRSRAAPVTYVQIVTQLTNLGCARNRGLYRHPRNKSIGIHFVKTAGGMKYVWQVLEEGYTHNKTRCWQMTEDYRL